MNIYYLILICIIGACLGSFYNVVILRSLSNESIVFPPSKCPKCGKKLLFWHNIPIISYFILKGKCYFCNEKISIQYPIIETITMLLFAYSYMRFYLTLEFYFAIILVSTLLIMAVTDIKARVVDCNIAIGLGIIGIIYNFILSPQLGFQAILGAGVAALIVEIIARLGEKPFGSRIMGEGDTYVAAALGACFGISNVITVLLYSLIASMLFAVPQFIKKQYDNGNTDVCILSAVFIISTFVFRYCQNFFVLAILAISGIMLALKILKNLSADDDKIIMPFVPAFALGAIFFLFFN